MRWFAGWRPGNTTSSFSAPAGARTLWSAAGSRLWAWGDWQPWEIRTTETPRLRVTVFGTCLATTAELASAAARVGTSGAPALLTDLPGNFTAVVSDELGAGEIGTVIVTDLAGLQPVFHTQWMGGTVFASSAVPLADLTSAGVDLDWLTATLFCPEAPEVTGTRSAFMGINRTRPGHILTLGPHRLTEQPLRIRLGAATFDEGAEALRRALVTAVERRVSLSRTVSADLSGGLDSTSLALLAAAHLPGGLTAITYSDPVSVNTDDLAYAHLAATTHPRLHQIVVTGNQATLPFCELDTVPLLDGPDQDTLLLARTRARLSPAHDASIHLSGDGGDAVLVGPLAYLADLARTGRIRDLLREATAWARLRHRPARTVLRAAIRLAWGSYPDAIKQAARQLNTGGGHPRRGIEDHLTWCGLSAAATWASPSSRTRLAARLAETAATLSRRNGSTADSAALREVHANATGAHYFAQLAAGLGVRVDVPFLDNQVLTACMGVPAADRTTATAAKPLLAAALDGLVPAAFLRRGTKGDYTAALFAGLQHAAPRLREWLADPLIAEYGLIDPGPLRTALETAVSGRSFPLAALGDALAIEQWLRALNRPRLTLWSPDKERHDHPATP